MISYGDVKLIWQDIKNDKTMVLFSKILLGLITASFFVVCVATLIRGYKNEPVHFLWGLYDSNPKDTVIKTFETKVYDTVYVKTEENPKLSTKFLHDNTTVKSINQKGGQIAREITNNK